MKIYEAYPRQQFVMIIGTLEGSHNWIDRMSCQLQVPATEIHKWLDGAALMPASFVPRLLEIGREHARKHRERARFIDAACDFQKRIEARPFPKR